MVRNIPGWKGIPIKARLNNTAIVKVQLVVCIGAQDGLDAEAVSGGVGVAGFSRPMAWDEP